MGRPWMSLIRALENLTWSSYELSYGLATLNVVVAGADKLTTRGVNS